MSAEARQRIGSGQPRELGAAELCTPRQVGNAGVGRLGACLQDALRGIAS